jgi:S1-C subfamily serine protease
VADSPAAQVGLRSGDVITQVDGKDIKGESDLAEALADKKPGDKVKLTIVRDGSTQTIEVTLGQAPA